jgi:Tfp pilus assembly protein PilO
MMSPSSWRAWRSMLPIWAPAVALCLAAMVAYAWQTSDSVGRGATLRNDTAALRAELARLERIRTQAAGERADVATLNHQFDHLYRDVFGNLDDRLTPILRAVGDATRQAGLLPGGYSYSARPDQKLKYTRFEIQFEVEGEYPQLRRLLAELQASPQFVIVSYIGISGDKEATSRRLAISIRLATYLAEANEDTLRRLTGGIQDQGTSTDDQAKAQG